MDAFIGEIRPFAFGWVPIDWILCNGQSLYIPQYQPLYTVIGDKYGSKQANTFQVPNLMGSAIVGVGQQSGGRNYDLGDVGGSENVALDDPNNPNPLGPELPNHTHTFNGVTGGGSARKSVPTDNTYYLTNEAYTATGGNLAGASGYVPNPPGVPDTQLNDLSFSSAGGSNGQVGAHENRQPYLVIGYYICGIGYFPSRP